MSGTRSPAPAPVWRLADRSLRLDRPVVAGILNVTPDSFSDGGRYLDPVRAAERAFEMVEAGAGLIDIGAESTRPGAQPVDTDAEWSRLADVLDRLSDLPVPISIDTMKAGVAERALDRGAVAINDVSGGRDPALVDVAARRGAGLVLMHMRGNPRTMQRDTEYADVVSDVRDALSAARDAAIHAGCEPETIAVDPGLGFGKSVEGNLELIARLDELTRIGAPLWIGPSRKSFLGKLMDCAVEDRLEGTIATCVAALARGARVFRVHDVGPVCRALGVAWAVERAATPGVTAGGGGRA
ncbi:MAG: dihydropteroate synthase [Gemmatimonadota bacterium]|nr:dihydropteroate synthase [Gemmatimonadota bacterium]